MPLAIGDIVTVVMEHSTYSEHQGEIVEIENDNDEDGPVGVRFGKWYRHLFGFSMSEDTVTVRFLEKELRKDDEWDLEVKILQRFGDHCWHSAFKLGKPFELIKRCSTKGCPVVNARRCLINIWGSVYEIDLCEECAREYDGMCCESFPSKPLLMPARA